MADHWTAIARRAARKGPYVETLWLRNGQRVIEKATGRVGIVERALTNLRYMISFGGQAARPVKGSSLELPKEN